MRPGENVSGPRIWASTVAALLLMLLPLPAWIAPARPDWLSLLVIYWVLRDPVHAGIGFAWLAGLAGDALCGGLLGPRALAMSAVAYVVWVLRARILHHSLPQQMAAVFALSVSAQVLMRWAQGFTGHPQVGWQLVWGSLTAAFCWPLIGAWLGTRGRMENWHASA
jgi:rod shape-determining protein MreD